MNSSILVIGIIQKDDQILLRRKPDGVGPYAEPWYLFGGKLTLGDITPEEVIQATVQEQTGLRVAVSKRLGWDTEIKPNEDGIETLYLYLDTLCDYVSGDLTPGPGIFKLEWAKIAALSEYDLNPPTKKLLRSVGYLQS